MRVNSSITKSEFVLQTIDWRTNDPQTACEAAQYFNNLGVEDTTIVPVKFGRMGFGLMLLHAYEVVHRIDPSIITVGSEHFGGTHQA